MPLPPSLITVLEAARREMHAASGEPTLKHLAWIIDELRKTLTAEDRLDLAEVTYKILVPINDAMRGIKAPFFTPTATGAGMPTGQVNIIVTAVRVVDEAMKLKPPEKERDAIHRHALPLVRRKFPEATADTIENWRTDLRRQTGKPSLPEAALTRYRLAVTQAGDTPESRLKWFEAVLRDLTSGPPISRKSPSRNRPGRRKKET